MTEQQIHSFLSIADGVSFTETARRFHISQPAASSQMARLEAELEPQRKETNQISVAILTGIGWGILSDAVSAFQQKYPDCQIQLHICNVEPLMHGYSPASATWP